MTIRKLTADDVRAYRDEHACGMMEAKRALTIESIRVELAYLHGEASVLTGETGEVLRGILGVLNFIMDDQ